MRLNVNPRSVCHLSPYLFIFFFMFVIFCPVLCLIKVIIPSLKCIILLRKIRHVICGYYNNFFIVGKMQWLTEVNFSVKLTFKVFTNGKFSKWNTIFLECDTFWVIFLKKFMVGFTWWHSGKECTCRCGRQAFNPWSRTIPHVERLWPTTIEPVL